MKMKTYKQIKIEGTANEILNVLDAISSYCFDTRCEYCPFHFHRDDSTECECNLNINGREPYEYKFDEIEEG